MERAVLTVDSKAALRELVGSDGQLGELQGGAGVWMCGSYAWEGIPLLEGCVASAKLVIEKGVVPSTAR